MKKYEELLLELEDRSGKTYFCVEAVDVEEGEVEEIGIQ